MDFISILVAAAVAAFVVALVLYFVSIFGCDTDSNDTWLPKLVVVTSLSFACYNVLLLPFDVAIMRSGSSVAHNELLVEILLVLTVAVIIIHCFFMCPFAMVYYETIDPDYTTVWKKVRRAATLTSILALSFCLLFVALWLSIGYSVFDYDLYTIKTSPQGNISKIEDFEDAYAPAVLRFHVSPFLYLVAFTCVVGWSLFFVFGGVGFVNIPADLLTSFLHRPKPITAAEYAERRSEIAEESQNLIEEGRALEMEGDSGKDDVKYRRKVLLFKRKVSELEKYYNKIETSYHKQGGHVLRGYLCLVLSVLSAFMTVAWTLHIVMYNILQLHPMLNWVFDVLGDVSLTLCVTVYGSFAFYLLCCVVNGCIKLGGVLALFQIYPIEYNNTLMSSFLFNSILIMITSMAVVQFCAMSFNSYSANTRINSMFMVYIGNLDGISYIVEYGVYAFLAVASVSFVVLVGSRVV